MNSDKEMRGKQKLQRFLRSAPLAVAIFAALATPPALAEPITGPVSHIRDGDTFVIRNQPIRLCGIDAPEVGTAGAQEATNYLRELTSGKSVKCIAVNEGTVCDGRSRRTNRDRIVAQCYVGGRDIARALVEARLACDWPRFSGGAYRVVGGCSR
jgi:endonuclease YncB( thermonuclease family)